MNDQGEHLLDMGLACTKGEVVPYINESSLAEGFIIPKKERLLNFLSKGHHQHHDNELKSQSRLISVLVGTRDGMQKWLRMCGPASSALWVEHPRCRGYCKGYYIGELKLVYRQRDYRMYESCVLLGCTLQLSIIKKPKKQKKKKMKDDHQEFDWIALRQREMARVHMIRDRACDNCLWERDTNWSIVVKATTFRQLSNMLSLRGALWEFRRLLRQVCHNVIHETNSTRPNIMKKITCCALL